MKKHLLAAAVALMATVGLQAQTKVEPLKILTAEQLPHPEYFLPAPAEPGSPIFYGDYYKYLEGKALRDTERGKQAMEDASLSIEHYMKRFGDAMGREMTPETYPLMAKYIQTTQLTVRKCISQTKKHFHRMRPYERFHEPSAVPGQEEKNDLTSYPSGHSIRAWSIAMALVAIDPDHQDEILKTGYELCRSRVIVGFHWQTDIEAAMISASAGYARLCFEPEFVELQKAAKAEYWSKK